MSRRTFIHDLVAADLFDDDDDDELEELSPETSVDILAAAGQEAPRRCRRCGCTDQRGCASGCRWVAVDLCSRCTR
jgi:hypothetical protein